MKSILSVLVMVSFAISAQGLDRATFAGGCFWCMQPVFDNLPGVVSTRVGYTGGKTENPTYREVSTGSTGHAEAIEITFDPNKIKYRKLLDLFWRNIDPTTKDKQFADKGTQYRTAIYTHSAEQEKEAIASKVEMEKSGKFALAIVTEITPAKPFYAAEKYHQQYYKKEPEQYKRYKKGSGREAYLEKMWGH